jgi:hypothetical protein
MATVVRISLGFRVRHMLQVPIRIPVEEQHPLKEHVMEVLGDAP